MICRAGKCSCKRCGTPGFGSIDAALLRMAEKAALAKQRDEERIKAAQAKSRVPRA